MKERDFDKTAYNNSYNAGNYDRLAVFVKKGEKEKIKERAKKKGFKSLNEYVINLIENDKTHT